MCLGTFIEWTLGTIVNEVYQLVRPRRKQSEKKWERETPGQGKEEKGRLGIFG